MISSFETEVDFDIESLHELSNSSAISDIVYNMFDYFFHTNDSAKKQNKWLFLFLAKNNDNIDLINEFINDEAVRELPISLIKTALLMVENNENINSQKIQDIYSHFLKDYPRCQL